MLSIGETIIGETQIKAAMIYHLIPVKMVIIKKFTNSKCWRGCGVKGTLLHCWWECKLVQPLWRTVWRFLKQTGNRTAIRPSKPTAGHTHRGNQNWKRHVCPNVLAVVFIIARTWKQPRCPSADEQIRKLWYIYTIEYYSAIKKNAFESVLMRWMKLESNTKSKVSLERKTPIQYINAYKWNL